MNELLTAGGIVVLLTLAALVDARYVTRREYQVTVKALLDGIKELRRAVDRNYRAAHGALPDDEEPR